MCVCGRHANEVREEEGRSRSISALSRTPAAISNMIQSLSWPAASTLTSVALSMAEGEVAYSREDVQTVVIVVTDGIPLSRYRTLLAAQSLQKKARVVVVPVGSSYVRQEASKWASPRKEDNYISPGRSFQVLKQTRLTNEILGVACPQLTINTR